MHRDVDDESFSQRGPVVRLDRASIDAVARRVVELLASESAGAFGASLTAAQVALRFGVSRTWVYENADRLGAIRLGEGARPRLRFDLDRVREVLARNERREPE